MFLKKISALNAAYFCMMLGCFFVSFIKSPSYFIFISGILILFCGQWKEKFNNCKMYYSFWATLLLLFFITLSIFISIKFIPFHSIWHNYSAYISWLLFFIVSISIPWPIFWKKKIMASFILGSVIASIIFSIIIHYNLAPAYVTKFLGVSVRLGMSYENPIQTSLVIACAAYLSFASLGEAKRYSHSWWWYFVALVITCVFLFFFNSKRTGMVAFFSMSFFYTIMFFSVRNRVFSAITILMIAILIYIISPIVNARINVGLSELKDCYNHPTSNMKTCYSSVGIRFVLFKDSLFLIRKSPFLGYGTGSFGTIYKTVESDGMTHKPESEYESALIQWGILGLTAYMLFFITIIKDACRSNSFQGKQALIITIGYLFAFFFSQPFPIWNTTLFFAAFTSIMISRKNIFQNS